MPRITIIDREHDEFVEEIPEGSSKTLLQIIQCAGIDINSSCGGGGWCSTCCVTVLEGSIGDGPEDALTAMDSEDLQTMEENNLDPSRQVLSCQCNIKHNCKVKLPDL